MYKWVAKRYIYNENNIFLHIIFEILKKFYIQNTNTEYRIQNFIYKKRTECDVI